MIYIDLFNNPPSDAWIAKAKKHTDKLLALTTQEERKEYIDKHSAVWGEAKVHLEKLSHGKCWYSETRDTFSYYQVEHFRPKAKALDENNNDQGGYYWLAFDWKNYRICGGVGNSKKSSKFAVKKNKANTPTDDLDDEVIYFLDPIDHDDILQLTFDEEGKIRPIEPNEAQWNFQRAKYTIQYFHLDYEKLETERKRTWKDCRDLIEEIKGLSKQQDTSPSATRKATIKSKMEDIRKKLSPCTPLSAVYRTCLQCSGYDWAVKLSAHHSNFCDCQYYKNDSL